MPCCKKEGEKPLSGETIRSFIAIEFPESVHQLCARIQRELAPSLGRISWVKYGNVHLTFKFLGDITPSQKEAVIHALEAPLAAHPRLEIALGGVGVFPNWRRPRVLWLGIIRGQEALTAIAATIDATLRPLGFRKEDKPFRPHLTLARIRRPVNLAPLQTQFQRYQHLDLEPISVDHLVLMRSVLHPKGSIYTPLHTFPLGTP